MREIIFKPVALQQYTDWAKTDRSIQKNIFLLLEEINKTPFDGIGKPEALKHQLKGCWSRRITKEHRLIYQVTPHAIIIISCKFHY
jgi:toxin YoeB